MQETTSKCRALFRPMLCVWLSLLLALSPAVRPRQAKAVAVFDDVSLALLVLSVLGYGVAAWQYSTDQTNVDQLAQLLDGFPTEGVAAAVQDGFLHVGDLATSTVESIGTWFNGIRSQLSGVGLDSPEGTVVQGLTNSDGVTITAENLYVSTNAVGPFSSDAVSLAQSHYGRVGQFMSCGYSSGSYQNTWVFYFTDPTGEGSTATTWTISAGNRISIDYALGVKIRSTTDNLSIKTVEYPTGMSGSLSGNYYHPNYISPMVLQGSGFPVTGGLYSDIPATVAPELDDLRTGTVAPADWPTALADLGGVVAAPVPTTTPTEVPSTDYPEWVWTPADDEALADWIQRHKTGTTDPDPEDPEDPDEDESKLPSPIPWWWPWDKPAPDVWTDIEGKIDEWTDPSFDPSPNADPDAGPGDGIGSLPANPNGPTPDPDPDKPTGDKTWDDIGYDLSHVFPFCLPFDLSRLLGLLVTDPVTPVLSWATPDPAGGNVMMSIDLTPWDPVAAAVRKVEILLFAVFLIIKTRDIMS